MYLPFRKLVALSLITVSAPVLVGCSRSSTADVAPLAAVATAPTNLPTDNSAYVLAEPNQTLTTGDTKAKAIAVAIANVEGEPDQRLDAIVTLVCKNMPILTNSEELIDGVTYFEYARNAYLDNWQANAAHPHKDNLNDALKDQCPTLSLVRN